MVNKRNKKILPIILIFILSGIVVAVFFLLNQAGIGGKRITGELVGDNLFSENCADYDLGHEFYSRFGENIIDQAESVCNSVDGDWIVAKDSFFCSAEGKQIIDCADSRLSILKGHCESIGAQWTCKTGFVGCVC